MSDTRQQLIKAFAQHQSGDLVQAIAGYDGILSREQENFDALHLSGVALYQSARYEEARVRLASALQIRPEDASAQSNLALTLMDMGRTADALEQFGKVIARHPDNAAALANRAACLNDLYRYDEALEDCEAALRLDPEGLAPAINQAVALTGLKKPANAQRQFAKLTEKHPDNVNAWSGLAEAQRALSLPSDAEQSFRCALVINPDHVPSLINFAGLLRDLERSDEGIKLMHHAIDVAPRFSGARLTLGNLIMSQRRYGEAIEAYQGILDFQPDDPFALYAEALCRLLLDELPVGFQLFENRWLTRPQLSAKDISTAPALHPGDDVAGKTILLWNDQGLGDAIQMARYAEVLRQQGVSVAVQVQEPLVRYLESTLPFAKVASMDATPPRHDVQCALLSMPWVAGTAQNNIPAPVAPIDLSVWRTADLTLPSTDGLRIGVAWSGNGLHVNDARRSISLVQMIRAVSGVTNVVVLQRDVRQPERDQLARTGWDWRPDAMVDFAATAALIDQIDLVVSVDTSVAHLAASLGKPTWLLTSWVPDWRWCGEGTTSEWYPAIRIFRQQTPGDWAAVLDSANEALALKAGGHPPPVSGLPEPNKRSGWRKFFGRADSD